MQPKQRSCADNCCRDLPDNPSGVELKLRIYVQALQLLKSDRHTFARVIFTCCCTGDDMRPQGEQAIIPAIAYVWLAFYALAVTHSIVTPRTPASVATAQNKETAIR